MKNKIEIITQGKKIRAVGMQMFLRPVDETFHEFYIKYLFSKFGKGWYYNEMKKPEDKKHVVVKWLDNYRKNFKLVKSSKVFGLENTWERPPTGDDWTLITMGYDLYSLQHNSVLPKKLIERLKKTDEFQGARYELAIAAVFARLDYEISFIEDKSKPHGEFVANHKYTDEKVIVETKSRHRPGVLDFPKPINFNENSIVYGIERLFNDALIQAPSDCTFMIFIDLNLLNDDKFRITDKPWWEELIRTFRHNGEPSLGNPDAFNLLVLTNFSYHYESLKIIDPRPYNADLCYVYSKFTKIPLKHHNTLDSIFKEMSIYGNVPAD